MKRVRKDIPLAIPQTIKDGYALCPAGGVFNSAFLHCKITRAAVVMGGQIAGTLLSADCHLLLYEGIEKEG